MITFIKRIVNRVRFKKQVRSDESINVVNSMAKARHLYKELSLKAHPDRNQTQSEIAEDLMQKLVDNKLNYAGLLALKKEIKEKLNR